MFVKVISVNQHKNRYLINKIGKVTLPQHVNSNNKECYLVNMGNGVPVTMETKNVIELDNVITTNFGGKE